MRRQVKQTRYNLAVTALALSIVIPTHGRPATVAECLRRIETQTVRDRLEVIVVSDGPDAATAHAIQGHAWAMPVQYLEIPKTQQGAARNRGVAAALGTHVLFIGDDIFLATDACERHIAMQKRFPAAAILGFTTWDPSVGITPVMRWLERTGWQFGYPQIARFAGAALPRAMQHRFTYTSHISVPRAVASAHPFRNDLTAYGWEDIAWGMALAAADVPLVYEPRAAALHHHRLTLADSLDRMRVIGASAKTMAALDARFDRVPRGWKRTAYRLSALLPTLRGKHARAFLAGLASA